MVDYYALISPTIEPLAEAPPEERKLVYERLVAMLDQQLRAADPPRTDKDILKERIQLETAIRRVERHILAKRPPSRPAPDLSTPTSQRPAITDAKTGIIVPTSVEKHSPAASMPEKNVPEVTAPEVTAPEVTAPEVIVPEVIAPGGIVADVVVPEVIIPESTAPDIALREIATPEPTAPEPINDVMVEATVSIVPNEDDGDASPETVAEMPKISEFPALLDQKDSEFVPIETEGTEANRTVSPDHASIHRGQLPTEHSLPTVAIKKSLFENRSRAVGPRDIFSRPLPVAADDHRGTTIEPKHDVEPLSSARHLHDQSNAGVSAPQLNDPDTAAPSAAPKQIEPETIKPAPFHIDDNPSEEISPPPEEARAFTPAPHVVITRDRLVSEQRKGLLLRLSILVLVLLALGAAVATVSEFLVRKTSETGNSKQGDVAIQSTALEAKFSDRLPVEPDEPVKSTAGTGTGTTTPSTTANAESALLIQRAVFIEEPAGGIGEAKRTEGRVIWKLETLKSSLSGTADLGVKASIELADVGLNASFVFRKNRDTTSVNAHLIEVSFQFSSDNANGKIRDISLPELRVDERTRGVTLAGIPVPVSDNVFLIGLNALPTDIQRNIDLLRTRNWFLLPLRYNTGKRALLLFEKGKPGERIFEDAIQAWK